MAAALATPQTERRTRLMPTGVENVRVTLLVTLTFVTGAVDAVSYIGLNRVFTANMTGNVALLGFAASGALGLQLLRPGIALLAFVLGAALGGRIVRRADLVVVWPARVVAALLFSVALLLAVFTSWVGHQGPAQPDLAAAGLALAMGTQGAATRKLNVADLPTTVITSTLTGLAADSFLGAGSGVRWRRRAAAVVSLVLGALSGGSLVQISPALGLLPAIAVLVGVVSVVLFARLHAEQPAADAAH